jgi:hypothetical protein
MSDQLMLDVGQANEFKLALRSARGRDGRCWTSDHINKLCHRQNLLGKILDVLGGRSEILPISPEATASALPGLAKSDQPQPSRNQFLRSITAGKVITLRATTGREFADEAAEVFPRGVDRDFHNWDLDTADSPTDPMPVEVFELVQDAKFKDLFTNHRCRPHEQLFFTLAQATVFCRHLSGWLSKKGLTLIPIKKKIRGKMMFFVVHVCVYDGGRFDVYVLGVSCDHVCHAERRHRVVTPRNFGPRVF